jgi:hypothetical protein
VHLYWHSFDLAVTRFSGRRAPEREGADRVTREAYSHEVISFGFWPGDKDLREPALYSYAAPEPAGITDQPLEPETALWAPEGGTALLMYEDVPKGYPACLPGERLSGRRQDRRLGRRGVSCRACRVSVRETRSTSPCEPPCRRINLMPETRLAEGFG